MKRKITILTAIASFFMMGSLNAQNHYCVQNNSGEAHLVTFDVSNGSLTDSIGVHFSNVQDDVKGFSGMAQDPTTGDIYVIVHDSSNVRHLGTIDVVSGDITAIGSLNINTSGLAIDGSGTIYCMEGDGSSDLYTLDATTAAETLFYTWDDQFQDSEAIAVNTTDGLLYRYDGEEDGSFYSLNLTTLVEDSIAAFSGVDTYGGALYYNAENNDFTLAQGEFFYHVTTAGVLTELSDITSLSWSGNFKGIVKVDYTGLTSVDAISEYAVFPNPSNGIVNIETNNEFTLEVVDVAGNVIQEHTNVSSIKIETPGVYFLNFTENNTVTTQKVIVK